LASGHRAPVPVCERITQEPEAERSADDALELGALEQFHGGIEDLPGLAAMEQRDSLPPTCGEPVSSN
jgi:hypothetical protein